jgi:hypothetical protein
MARAITYAVIALLGLFVLFTTFIITRGGGSATQGPQDRTLSVHDLSLEPESYRGDTVTTEGNLLFSPDIKQYQIVDEGVAIVVIGYEEEAFQGLEGRRVTVTGRFDFDLGTGIFIDVEFVREVPLAS